MCRATGIPGSRRLNIKDEVIAWDFDRAVSRRLVLWDAKQRADEMNAMWGSGEAMTANSAPRPTGPGVHPMIAADPFADHQTTVM